MTKKDNRLLIVDDQQGVRRLLYEAFTDEGYRVRIAAGGQEALKMIGQEVPDIILLDVKMPGMNGLETLAELKKINANIPVLMMTAYGDLDMISHAKRLGVKHYITKPFDLNEVKLLVKGLLADSGQKSGELQEIG